MPDLGPSLIREQPNSWIIVIIVWGVEGDETPWVVLWYLRISGYVVVKRVLNWSITSKHKLLVVWGLTPVTLGLFTVDSFEIDLNRYLNQMKIYLPTGKVLYWAHLHPVCSRSFPREGRCGERTQRKRTSEFHCPSMLAASGNNLLYRGIGPVWNGRENDSEWNRTRYESLCQPGKYKTNFEPVTWGNFGKWG